MDKRNKLAVLFPGTGYTCGKPLLRTCAEAYAAKGYEIVPLSYGGLDFRAMETIAEAVEAAAAAVRGGSPRSARPAARTSCSPAKASARWSRRGLTRSWALARGICG